MKMRYCFLISVVPSIIIGGVLSHFIEILASIGTGIFSYSPILLIISSIADTKQCKINKRNIILCISCILAICSMALIGGYKGERNIIFNIVIFAICEIGYLTPFIMLMLLRKDKKDDTK